MEKQFVLISALVVLGFSGTGCLWSADDDDGGGEVVQIEVGDAASQADAGAGSGGRGSSGSTTSSSGGTSSGTGGSSSGGTSADAGSGSGSGGGSSTGGTRSCYPTCDSPSDCTQSGSAYTADDWKCTNGVCRADFCSKNAECTPFLSGWTQKKGCSVGDCEGVYTCIEFEDSTYCALENTDRVNCPSGWETGEFSKADGSGSVSICHRSGTCTDESYCTAGNTGSFGCDDDSECRNGGRCNESSGVCVCQPGDCADGYQCASL